MPRVKGRPPATSRSGLVHVHILVPPAIHAVVNKARRKMSKSAYIVSILAGVHGLEVPAVGARNLLRPAR